MKFGTKPIETGSEFTPEGLAKLKKGQVLVYNMEGSRKELKITSINRKSHKLYVQETKLYTEDDINQLSNPELRKLGKHGSEKA